MEDIHHHRQGNQSCSQAFPMHPQHREKPGEQGCKKGAREYAQKAIYDSEKAIYADVPSVDNKWKQ